MHLSALLSSFSVVSSLFFASQEEKVVLFCSALFSAILHRGSPADFPVLNVFRFWALGE
jgi:hypothetical protein